MKIGEESDTPIRNNQTKAYAEQIVSNCKSSIHCPVLAVDNLTKTEGRQIVLGTFSDVVQLYDERTYVCHETAHHLGIWLYSYLADVKQALLFGNHLCDGGVFHGVFQGYFSTQHLVNHVNENQIAISQLCTTASPENINLLDTWNCTHGIGHGLTDLYDYNTTAAVARCNDLEVDWEQTSCSKGVFMENEVQIAITGQGDVDAEDIFYPCDRTAEKFAPECYLYHSEYLINKNNHNVGASFEECDSIIPTDLVKYCYEGVGRALSTSAYGNIENGIKYCYIGTQSAYHNDCQRVMVRGILKLRTSTDAGFQFCNASRTDFKAECFEIAGEWIKLLYPDKDNWLRECSKANGLDYVEICMTADPEKWIREL